MVGIYVCIKNIMGQEPVVVHQIVISRIFMVSLILALFYTLKDKIGSSIMRNLKRQDYIDGISAFIKMSLVTIPVVVLFSYLFHNFYGCSHFLFILPLSDIPYLVKRCKSNAYLSIMLMMALTSLRDLLHILNFRISIWVILGNLLLLVILYCVKKYLIIICENNNKGDSNE